MEETGGEEIKVVVEKQDAKEMPHRVPVFFNTSQSVISSIPPDMNKGIINMDEDHSSDSSNNSNRAATYSNDAEKEQGEHEDGIENTIKNDSAAKNFSATALYDYDGIGDEELSFKAGDVIFVLEQDDSGWAAGEIKNKNDDKTTDGELKFKRGLFPMNYVSVNTPETI